MKRRYLAAIALVVVVVPIISISLYQSQSQPSAPPTSPIELVSYEWDVKVINWEHEYVEVNFTLYNPNNYTVDFNFHIKPYDGDVYFGYSKRCEITLPAKSEETFTKRAYYELLFNHHHANAVELIAGILDENKIFKEIYFQEFSSKA